MQVYATVRIVIVANAPVNADTRLTTIAANADYIIAADGGAKSLISVGIVPHLLIGDLDSLSADHVESLISQGVEVQRYAREKDETDLELALIAAVARNASQIDMFCVLGGRWDHTVATIAMLSLPMLIGRTVRIFADGQTLAIVRDQIILDGPVTRTVSLLPLTPTVDGISTIGLAYPLSDATLYFERSRGVSNVITQMPATIQVKAGILLVVQHAHPVE
ncbi:MAG: thiamine diphosphokinase [Chloroflexia bacterium]|nr:thiamine diphosphokinase [Chloroflexia bacterium]